MKLSTVVLVCATLAAGAFVHAGAAFAQATPQTAPVVAPADLNAKLAGGERVKACGTEWKARTDAATNKGREAWFTFLHECVIRHGGSPKPRTAVAAKQ